MLYSLTKSKFLLGLNCTKALWLQTHHPEIAAEFSAGTQRLLEQGNLIGEYARRQFPNGYLITTDYGNVEKSLEDTKIALNNSEYVFEGTFLYDDILVKADILHKTTETTFDLIEIKSSTHIKEEHIPDVSIQKYVIENSGTDISHCSVMHINKECVFPDLTNLFSVEDITESVDQFISSIPENITELKSVLTLPDIPDIGIGVNCSENCSFYDYCWGKYGTSTIFHIPHLHNTKKNTLIDMSVLLIEDIPPDFKLSDKQMQYVEMIRTNTPCIDQSSIKKELASLHYPLYFLDFETDNPAIPRFDGMHPYDVIPFQYSCHILYKDGTNQHFEYLHTDLTDPRPKFVNNLLEILGNQGSIIVYNAAFEKTRLNNLIVWFPELAGELESVIDRIWDQLMIFKNYYKHPQIGPSNSIKSVLPVLVPELSYSSLNVQQGGDAQYTWNILINETDTTKKEKICTDLKEYCNLDTLAMLKIHEVLAALN